MKAEVKLNSQLSVWLVMLSFFFNSEWLKSAALPDTGESKLHPHTSFYWSREGLDYSLLLQTETSQTQQANGLALAERSVSTKYIFYAF